MACTTHPNSEKRCRVVWSLLSLLLIGACIAGATLVNHSAVHWRETIDDDHLFAYFGWRVSQGARPYIDVWDNKPPGIWWINAAGAWACGPGRGREILICSLATAVSLAAFAGIARCVFHRSLLLPGLLLACILLTHLGLECGANRTETFVVLCEVLAVLGYSIWLKRRGLIWLFLAGLAAGCAPLFKQAGLAAGAACAIHLLIFQLRGRGRSPRVSARWYLPWAASAGGFAVAPLLAGIALSAQGALGEAWFATTVFNQAYFAINDASWMPIRQASSAFAHVLPPFYGILLLGGLGGLFAATRAKPDAGVQRRTHNAASASQDKPADAACPVGLFWVWFLLAVYLAAVGPGRQGYHLMPAATPLCLLAIAGLQRLCRGRSLPATIVSRPTAAAILVLYAYVAVDLAVDNSDRLSAIWATKPSWLALQRTTPTDWEQRGALLRARTAPSDTIYVWGWSPGTYRYAYRACPSRFATLEKIGQVGAHAEFILQAAMNDIRARPPAAMFISTADFTGMMAEPRSDFATWVDERYATDDTIGGMHLLLRR